MLNELIERCKKNDRKAQKIVYEYLFGKMYSLSMRYAKNEDDAGEILNTAFYKVFTKLNDYSGNGSFEGWVRSIVVRTAIDLIRKNKTYNDVIMVDSDSNFESGAYYEMDFIDTEELFTMIASLPHTTRSVFNMVAIDGYKHEEAAEMLGISYQSSRWHLSEARRKLKMMIENKKKKLGRFNHG